MLSHRSTDINRVLFANAGENAFYGGEQSMFIPIEMWLYPFTFQNLPKRFRDVEMRGIRRKIEYMETPFFPSLKTSLYHAALALETLWRCCLMASLTASMSSLVLMMRLRPFPDLFFNPAMPSDWNLLTQCMTRWYVCPPLAPAAALLRPSVLPNTIRHRIRNEWVAPFRYPFSKAALCSL